MTVEDNARLVGLPWTHLSPELVPFFLSGIQSQFAVDILLLFFGLILEIFIDGKIEYLVRVALCEGCGQISTTPPTATTSASVSVAFPSFVV